MPRKVAREQRPGGGLAKEPAVLGESADRLRELVENIKHVFWIISGDLTEVLYISPAYEAIWGRTCRSLLESPHDRLEAIHADDRSAVERQYREGAAGGDYSVEYRITRPDGEIRWVRDRAFPIRDERGKTIRIVGIAEDITRWKQIESELRTSEEHNRLISELTADYAYTGRIEPDGTIVVERQTEGFTRVTGYTHEEMNRLGGWQILFHPDDIAAVEERSQNNLDSERHVDETRIVTKDGAIRWIRYSSQRFASSPGGRVDRLVGAVQDITERRLAEDRLRDLSRRLLEVQEQERRHLARELHDEVGQHLTALNLNLEAAAGLNQAEARRGLEQARALVKDLAGRIRNLSLQLRPTMLDDLGLVPALLWLFDSWTARTRIAVQFEHHGLSRRLGHEVETAAYRIIQEALTNVARHAGANDVTVRAWLADDRIHLTVEDRGRGFDAESALRHGASAGLSGMRERATLLAGELSVESIPERGTRIAAILPALPLDGGNRP